MSFNIQFDSVWFIFTCITLLVTTFWVWAFRKHSFGFLAIAMFFPSLVASYHLLLMENSEKLLFRALHVNTNVIVWTIVGCIIELVVVLICLLLAIMLGLADFTTKEKKERNAVHEHNENYLMAFLRASGEEFGWRGFMLPLLLIEFTPTQSMIISGIVWGLYHVPVMILLASNKTFTNALTMVIMQCISCVFHAFPYVYVTIRANFSFLPAAAMHFFWNQINPRLIGSIYTQTNGYISGNQSIINGEGLLGCLVGFLVAILISYTI